MTAQLDLRSLNADAAWTMGKAMTSIMATHTAYKVAMIEGNEVGLSFTDYRDHCLCTVTESPEGGARITFPKGARIKEHDQDPNGVLAGEGDVRWLDVPPCELVKESEIVRLMQSAAALNEMGRQTAMWRESHRL